MLRYAAPVLVLLIAMAAPAQAGPPMPLSVASEPASLTASNAVATIKAEAQPETVYPNDARRATVAITTTDLPVWLVVVIVPLRSPVQWSAAGDGACEQPTDEKSGGADWLTCRWFNPPVSSTIELELTMLRPVGIVTNPIAAGCSGLMSVGVPVSVAVNGEMMIDQGVVWSPYQPAYCTYWPRVER